MIVNLPAPHTICETGPHPLFDLDMKTAIDIQISDKSLKEAGINYEQILDASLEALAHLYNRHNLDFDCGYNPKMITSGIRN